MAELNRVRRYYLRQRYLASLDDELRGGIEAVFRAKQEAIPATALPADFPFLGRLAAVGYTTIDDLHGADGEELSEQGFSHIESIIILDELDKLPVPVDPPVVPDPGLDHGP
jgi:hypothetical protein